MVVNALFSSDTPFTYRARIPVFHSFERDLEVGETLSMQFPALLPFRARSSAAPGFSVSPELEHTFGACFVEMEIIGAEEAAYAGTAAEYDVPTTTLHLMANDDDGNPVRVRAVEENGELAKVSLTRIGRNFIWSPASEYPASLQLEEGEDTMTGTLTATFNVDDRTTLNLVATFDAMIDDDGTATGCVY